MTMLKKVISCIFLLSLTDAAYKGPLAGGLPAALYPAGLDPRTCPNFPDCRNPAVAAIQGQSSYQTPSHFQQPRQAIQLQQPVYQPRHTASPVVQQQKYNQPQFEYTRSAQQFTPQHTQAQFSQGPQYQQGQQYPQGQQYIQGQEYPQSQQHSQGQQYPQSQQYSQGQGQQQHFTPAQRSRSSSRDQQYTAEQKRALDRGEYIGDGDYHGEGLSEALAPESHGQQQSYQAAAVPTGQHNTPAYQKVSAFLAQSQNVHQTPTNQCRNYPHC